MNFLPKATLAATREEMRFGANASLSDKVRAHRAAVLSAANQERLKRLLQEAQRAAIKG